MGPELALRIVWGKSPLLADKQTRGANTSVPQDARGAEITHIIVTAFVELVD